MKAINPLKLIVVGLSLLVPGLPALAQIHVAGELYIDLNVSRGTNLMTGQNTNIPAEVSLVAWTNYGTLGGKFDDASNSVYSATITGNAFSNAPFITNVLGTNAPATFGGTRLMVFNTLTPAQLQGNAAYSVECWFYTTSVPADPRGLFGWTLEVPPNGDAGELGAGPSAAWHNDPNTLTWNPAATAPSFLAWHYGVITYDGTRQVAYLDGSPVNTNTGVLNLVATNATGIMANPTLFSGLNAIPATGTVGSGARDAIAALRVHSDALTAADVAANFAAGATTVPAALNISLEIAPVSGPELTTPTLNANLVTASSAATVVFMYDTVDHGRQTNGWAHYVVAPGGPFSAPSPVTAGITGLPNSTTFYVRAYATNSGDTNISAVTSFLSHGLPQIVNTGAFFASPGSDYVGGALTVDGDGSGFSHVILYYGPTDGGSNPGSWANSIDLGGVVSLGALSPTISGLTALGNYFFTFSAQNSFGTAFATPSASFQEGVLFSVNTAKLPAPGLPPAAETPITSWPAQPAAFVPRIAGGGANGIPGVHAFGGVNWVDTSPVYDDNLSVPPTSFPGGALAGTGYTNIPINGGTVIATIKPTGVGPNDWENIAMVYFSQLGLATESGTIKTLGSGSVQSITINNGGSGYTSAPTVTIAPPGGIAALDSTATATAHITGGVVDSVTITSGGKGYPTVGGGANGNTAGTLYASTGFGPGVTFSPPSSGTTATGTAVLTPTSCVELMAAVNSDRPEDDSSGAGNGRNARTGVYVPLNQTSIVSLVAGSGQSSGVVGDNNYFIYVNGIKVLDSDFGFVTGVDITNGGNGYLAPPTVTFPAPTNSLGAPMPGGVTATGTATINGSGQVTGVNIVNPGAGYIGNGIAPGAAGSVQALVTFSAPAGANPTNAGGQVQLIPLGDYNPVPGATTAGAVAVGRNGGDMHSLVFNLEGYAGNGTFVVGQDGSDIDPWSGYKGYIGDVTVYATALSDVNRQAVENAEATKFITGATLSFTITTSILTPSGSINGPASVIQGNDATYAIVPSAGFAVTNVYADGVAQGAITSYTFQNVSAAHTLSAGFVSVPQQQITASVTGGTGGQIVPSGVISVVGGGSQFISIQPSNGFVLSSLTVDGSVIPNPLGTTVSNYVVGGSNPGYTFNNLIGFGAGTNHTIAVAFSPVSLLIPKSDSILFSLDVGALPQTANTDIPNWPVYTPVGIAPLIVDQNPVTNVVDANGVVWENNTENEAGNNTILALGADQTSTLAYSIPTPGGVTVTFAANPNQNGLGVAWNQIVSFYYNSLVVGIRNDNGAINLLINGNYYDTAAGPGTLPNGPYLVPNGTNEVVSLVMQPSGAFAVYANTVLVLTNSGTGPFTSIDDGINTFFSHNIAIGGEWIDPWPEFNGKIGDVFVYATALNNTDRLTLEGALMTKFHAVVPPNYNWVGPNGGNWSTLANWSNTVPLATNTVPGLNGFNGVPTFSLTSAAGAGVNLDVSGVTINGLTVNGNDTNAVISGANTLTLDSGSASATPLATVAAGSTESISASLTSVEGLNVVGGGTLSLSGPFTLLSSANGFLGVARDSGNTAGVTISGGQVTTIPVAQSWRAANGPGVMLGGADNSATTSILNLNGGTLITPNIGNVTEPNFTTLSPPSTVGGTAIVNLNGGTLQPSDSDSIDTDAIGEGSAHLIFNTSHTYVRAGGAIFNMQGFTDSINVPLEHAGGPVQDGGLTVEGFSALTLLQGSTYTGPTKIQGSAALACTLTNSLGGDSLDITTGASLQLNFTGTSPVYRLTFDNGPAQATGTWGATGSGAANIDNTHFAGTGTVTVIGTNGIVTPHFTGSVVTGGGTNITLTGTGGKNGGTYTVLGSTNVAAPLSSWSTVGQGTFTAGPAFSISIPVTNGVPAAFYDVIIP